MVISPTSNVSWHNYINTIQMLFLRCLLPLGKSWRSSGTLTSLIWTPSWLTVIPASVLSQGSLRICSPPSCSVEFKVTSDIKWVADLKENHLHAILSGFPVGDTQGVGTFYDFQSRLWTSDKDNLSDPVHPPEKKPKKPDKKGEKAPPVEKVTFSVPL